MNTTTLSIITGISLSLLISQCKSPGGDKGMSEVNKTDTTAVAKDTSVHTDSTGRDSAQAVAPLPDTTKTQTPLTLVIKNLQSATAPVIVGLYGTQNKFSGS